MGHLFSMMHPLMGTALAPGEFPAADLGDSTIAFSGGAQELSGTPMVPSNTALRFRFEWPHHPLCSDQSF